MRLPRRPSPCGASGAAAVPEDCGGPGVEDQEQSRGQPGERHHAAAANSATAASRRWRGADEAGDSSEASCASTARRSLHRMAQGAGRQETFSEALSATPASSTRALQRSTRPRDTRAGPRQGVRSSAAPARSSPSTPSPPPGEKDVDTAVGEMRQAAVVDAQFRRRGPRRPGHALHQAEQQHRRRRRAERPRPRQGDPERARRRRRLHARLQPARHPLPRGREAEGRARQQGQDSDELGQARRSTRPALELAALVCSQAVHKPEVWPIHDTAGMIQVRNSEPELGGVRVQQDARTLDPSFYEAQSTSRPWTPCSAASRRPRPTAHAEDAPERLRRAPRARTHAARRDRRHQLRQDGQGGGLGAGATKKLSRPPGDLLDDAILTQGSQVQGGDGAGRPSCSRREEVLFGQFIQEGRRRARVRGRREAPPRTPDEQMNQNHRVRQQSAAGARPPRPTRGRSRPRPRRRKPGRDRRQGQDASKDEKKPSELFGSFSVARLFRSPGRGLRFWRTTRIAWGWHRSAGLGTFGRGDVRSGRREGARSTTHRRPIDGLFNAG